MSLCRALDLMGFLSRKGKPASVSSVSDDSVKEIASMFGPATPMPADMKADMEWANKHVAKLKVN